jgi:hypothetical protein
MTNMSNPPSEIPFSIALQESLGSVRPYSGDYGRSRGIFQLQHPSGSSDTVTTCKDTPVDGCPKSQIYAMAKQGICGFSSDGCRDPLRPGIAAYWRKYKNESADIGLTARAFNSGSVYNDFDLTAVTTGTSSYASDIVNRAMGRVTGTFFSHTCCARCDKQRVPQEIWTCEEWEAMKDFCGDERYGFNGRIG